VKDLIDRNLWNDNIRDKIIMDNGSVQNIDEIPEDLKLLYRTVWEIKQRHLIEMAADRAPFIDQSQSLNIYIAEPNFGKLTSILFYGWQKQLKTGMYYLRSKPAANPIPVTVPISVPVGQSKNNNLSATVCSLNSDVTCESCQ